MLLPNREFLSVLFRKIWRDEIGKDEIVNCLSCNEAMYPAKMDGFNEFVCDKCNAFIGECTFEKHFVINNIEYRLCWHLYRSRSSDDFYIYNYNGLGSFKVGDNFIPFNISKENFEKILLLK